MDSIPKADLDLLSTIKCQKSLKVKVHWLISIKSHLPLSSSLTLFLSVAVPASSVLRAGDRGE